MTKPGESVVEPSWVPAACALPTIDQPLRTEEFNVLLASAVIAVERPDKLTARLHLRPEPTVAARAAELAMRETDCCSFFTFTLSMSPCELILAVAVPVSYVAVLDSLLDRPHTPSSAGSA